MTTSARTPAEAAAAMSRTPAPQPPAEAPVPAAHNVAGIGRRAWEQFADNPLHALFGTAIVALLIFGLTTTNARIDDTNALAGSTTPMPGSPVLKRKSMPWERMWPRSTSS